MRDKFKFCHLAYQLFVLLCSLQTPTEHLREFSAKVTDVELITGLEFFPGLAPVDRIRQQIRVQSNLWGSLTWANRLRSDLFGLKR